MKTEGFRGQGWQGQHLTDEKSERTDGRWRRKQAVECEVSGAQPTWKPQTLCGAAGTLGEAAGGPIPAGRWRSTPAHPPPRALAHGQWGALEDSRLSTDGI